MNVSTTVVDMDDRMGLLARVQHSDSLVEEVVLEPTGLGLHAAELPA